MSYVLKRVPDGAYVSRADLNVKGASYSYNLREAVLFPDRQAAEADRCVENEVIVPVDGEFRGRAR